MIQGRLTTTTALEDLKDVDLVIEAVLENLKVKQDIWSKLGGALSFGGDLRDQYRRPAHRRDGLGP